MDTKSPFLTRIDVYYENITGIVDYSIYIKTDSEGFTVTCPQMGLNVAFYPFDFAETIEELVVEASEDFGLGGLVGGEDYDIFRPNI